MFSGRRIAALASAGALALSFSPATAAAAESCASRSEVRTQVADLVRGLRDDVRSRSARSAAAHALVEVVHTFRGAKADDVAERRALGREISALAKDRREAGTRVERKAALAEIKALREQRERGAFTAEERADLRAAVVALRKAVAGRTDSRAERREVAVAVRELQAQFSCR